MRFYGIKKGLCWTAKVRLWQWIISSQLELLTNSHLTFLKLTTLEDKGTHTELKYFYFLRLYGLILRPVLSFLPLFGLTHVGFASICLCSPKLNLWIFVYQRNILAMLWLKFYWTLAIIYLTAIFHNMMLQKVLK